MTTENKYKQAYLDLLNETLGGTDLLHDAFKGESRSFMAELNEKNPFLRQYTLDYLNDKISRLEFEEDRVASVWPIEKPLIRMTELTSSFASWSGSRETIRLQV